MSNQRLSKKYIYLFMDHPLTNDDQKNYMIAFFSIHDM